MLTLKEKLCLHRVSNRLTESAEYRDLKSVIQTEGQAGEASQEELEAVIKAVIKTHQGKMPSKDLIIKWIRGYKSEGFLDLDKQELSKKARLQNVLERMKLIDCRQALGCHLNVKTVPEADRLEEKQLYKQIFETEMQVSIDDAKSLKTIEENFENEWMTTEKKQPPNRDTVQHEYSQADHDKRESYKILINGEEEEDKQNKSIYEINKIERALFRSRSKDD